MNQEQSKSMGAVMEMDGSDKQKKKGTWTDWVYSVGRKHWVVIGAAVLIGAAVWINLALFGNSSQTGGYADYGNSSGMASDAGAAGDGTDGASNATANYFATVEVNRKRARDESLEVLQNVLDSEDATEAVKNEALSEMNVIANEIEKEANVEALLVSAGFEDCVAVMNGNSIQVVVQSEGELQTAQIARINTIVYEQTGIEPLNVVIVHKN